MFRESHYVISSQSQRESFADVNQQILVVRITMGHFLRRWFSYKQPSRINITMVGLLHLHRHLNRNLNILRRHDSNVRIQPQD